MATKKTKTVPKTQARKQVFLYGKLTEGFPSDTVYMDLQDLIDDQGAGDGDTITVLEVVGDRKLSLGNPSLE